MVTRLAAVALPFLLGSVGCEGCLRRQPRDHVEVLPYPTCPDGTTGPVRVLAEETLRAGTGHPTPELVEHYRLEERGCLRVLTVRQSWSRQVDDVEVVYDASYRPLRAWKRMTVPAAGARRGLVDVRRYELRVTPATMTLRDAEGVRHYAFRGGTGVTAVLGPGRGVVLPWLRALEARGALPTPGSTVRETTLDVRELVERVEPIALRREDDADVPGLGRVEVYTVYGRESVFVRDGRVVGDLLGLRPASRVQAPMPPPVPMDEAPDPVNTP